MTILAVPERPVIECEYGITVYPARWDGDRWRAVWYENGERQQCESVLEDRLAEKLEKITERLAADAPHMTRPGADLVAFYLNPDRLPVASRWSRRHADNQRRLCARFALPVIADVTCQDITVPDMQAIVNAAPTASEGDRVHRMISAMVNAGIEGGYLVSARLGKVHWQADGRPVPLPAATAAGESGLLVDPAEIPANEDVAALGHALASRHGERDELMANLAAYSGLRWGELAALCPSQVNADEREITVERKVVEVGGHMYVETPKNRKRRRTVYPRLTPAGYPLAAQVAARLKTAENEQAAGKNPLGLMFPSPNGTYWWSSNFNRRVLKPAYLASGWRGDVITHGKWTWHSLRHVFCTTALFTWKLDATDVSRMAGHSSYRVTLDMYVGTTAGVLDRARTATA